jgi:hypothetical protein
VIGREGCNDDDYDDEIYEFDVLRLLEFGV